MSDKPNEAAVPDMHARQNEAEQWRQKCKKTKCFSMFFPDSRPDREFEDDGALHVVRFGIRAVFDVSGGQSYSPHRQNMETRAVLRAMGIKRDGDMVLVDDPDTEAEHEPER